MEITLCISLFACDGKGKGGSLRDGGSLGWTTPALSSIARIQYQRAGLTQFDSLYNWWGNMMRHTPHKKVRFTPPWSCDADWQAANDAMAAVTVHRADRFGVARSLAAAIRIRMNRLDPFLEALCADTCPTCRDNCCGRATVWYDFRDLLGFHLNAAAIPAGQMIPSPDRSCQYLATSGCTFPRSQRPFICTWFVCAAQKRAMADWPRSHRIFLLNSLDALKQGRKCMERHFIQAVVR